ncbi:hypothetical protein [Streptomyces sp. NPDC006368]|uniref:hypothetical protein n=1 Tax=Streptomyces sp. NPDC006368 TaxID=3156760 RepID=UPI0033A3D5D4
MSAIRLWRRRTRQADKPVAVIVGIGNLLLSGALFLMTVGVIFEATTREEEIAAQRLAAQIFGYWLAGGLMLSSVLCMTRTLFSHLVTMIFPPTALILTWVVV